MRKDLRRRLSALAILVFVAVIASSGYLGTGTLPVAAAAEEDSYDIPANSFYNRDSAHWQELDNEFTAAVAPWDWEVLEADYHLRVKEDFTAGQIMELALGGSTIQLQPMGLEWSNALSMIQAISMPQDVTPVITNPEVSMLGSVKHQGTIAWNDAYGSNIDFEWKSTPAIVKKTLTISSLSDLPAPEQYIIDGGDPFLQLNLIFDPSSDLDIYVDSDLWDKQTEVQTFENIEFRKGGEILWVFMPLIYWDSADNEGQSVATLEKSGNKLYISVRVPYSWLQAATFPVYVDTDVQIEAGTHTTTHLLAARGGVFWTSPLIGYVVYVDNGSDLSYRKTSDGGVNWDAAIELLSGTVIMSYDSWADWQTPTDAGTVIHIALIDGTADEVTYVYLDTSDDSTGNDMIEACQSGTFATAFTRTEFGVSITKAKGGNIAVSFFYKNTIFNTYYGFYTSPDGDAWTSRSNPRELSEDHLLLFPGNETDTQDLWAMYWDTSADFLSLKTYDNSGNSWSEQALAVAYGTAEYLQMDGAIRISDGHLIFTAWIYFDSSAADIRTWDINGSSDITSKANVLTNSAESFLTSVFIDQSADDIYVAYAKGGTIESTVTIYYKKSTNGGADWGSQTAMQANAADDERWVSCGAMKEAWGGKFLPIWFNDDVNDLFCNTDNGISIDAVPPPDPPTNVAATDGAHTDKVVITWTKSTGATGYKVYEGSNLLDTLGDVATYDDTAAPAPTITPGSAVASDGSSTAHVALSLSGTSTSNGASRTYKVRAFNDSGDSGDSNTDTGYRGVGGLSYQWQRSAADSNANYSNIDGATSATHEDTAAPQGTITPGTAVASDGSSTAHVALSLSGASTSDGAGRYYKCILNADGAAQQTSAPDRGYRTVGSLTYQWQRSAADSDADYSNIDGATASTYNDTAAPQGTITPGSTVATDGDSAAHVALSLSGTSASDGAGRYYRCVLNADGAVEQTSAADRGYRGIGELTYQWQRSTGDSDDNYSNIDGATSATHNDAAAPAPTITPGSADASDGTSGYHVVLDLSGHSGNDGAGRYYKCVLNAAGAVEQTSSSNRGYRGASSLSFQWQRSAADSDASYSNINGATTDPYNDTGGVRDPDGRYYKCTVSMSEAGDQTSSVNRGYMIAISAPTVDNHAATGIGSTSATLRGEITDTGYEDASERGFEWSLSSGDYTDDWSEMGSFGTGLFSHGTTGLPCFTTIYWRAYATNSGGTGYSAERNFSTASCGLHPPTDFAVVQTDVNSINATWTMGSNATHTFIRVSTDGYPATPTEGYQAYNGTGTSFNMTGLTLDTTTYYFSVWSVSDGSYSETYATAQIGGHMLLLILLGILALGLTVTMFATKNAMLGFPAGIFWGILGGFAYQQSTATWDLQYLLFFGAIGMVIFSIFAAYTLRKQDLAGPDTDKFGAFMDETKRGPRPLLLRGRTTPTTIVPPGVDAAGSWGDIDRLGMNDMEDKRALPTNQRRQGIKDRAARRRLDANARSGNY